MKEELEKEVTEEIVEEVHEEKDMTPILLEDLGMMYANETSKRKRHYGIFKCQYCGKEFKSNISNVKRGQTKGCGCLNGVNHGLSCNKFYHTWNGMMYRCYNKTNKSYLNYGGRGIKVGKEWHDMHTFIAWAKETYIDNYTLDRIDNNGNYDSSNCRWASISMQNMNRRAPKSNKSGFVGVSWNEGRNKWEANLSINRKQKYLGIFTNKMDAVKARDNYIIENNLPHKLSTDYKEESR